MAKPTYYEGQKFPPKDPTSGLPTLVYRAGKFYNAANDPGEDSNIPPVDRKRLGDMGGAADTAGQLAAISRASINDNKSTSSGGILAAPVIGDPMAKFLGATFDPALGDMNSNATQMAGLVKAPNMRLTQMEFARYAGAVPSPTNSPETNAAIDSKIQNMAQWTRARQTYYRTWADHNGSLAGADPAWQSWEAQHFGPDGSFVPQGIPQTPAAPATAPANGGWSLVGTTPVGN